MKYLPVFLIIILFISYTEINAQWIKTNGPFGGTVNCIISDTLSLYIGTMRGGVFKSKDDGENWAAISSGLTNLYVNALAFSGQNLLAGTEGGGIFISENKGLTWKPVSFPIPYVTSFTSLGKYTFAATWNGIYISTDNGFSWSYTGLQNNNISFLLADGTELFTAGQRGVNMSSDTGKTWKALGNNMVSWSANTIFKDSTGLYAGTDDGLLYLKNNSSSWEPCGLPGLNVTTLTKTESNLAAGTNEGVYLSSDNGIKLAKV